MTQNEMVETMKNDHVTIAEAMVVLIKELHRAGIQSTTSSVQSLVTVLAEEFPGTFEIE